MLCFYAVCCPFGVGAFLGWRLGGWLGMVCGSGVGMCMGVISFFICRMLDSAVKRRFVEDLANQSDGDQCLMLLYSGLIVLVFLANILSVYVTYCLFH